MFGEYELEARLHPAIWLGQKKETAGQTQVCIKMVTLAESGQRDIRAAKHLLVSAAVQQSISQHSMRWVPVLHLGSDGVDSFYILPRYPRSLQTLVDQRIPVDAQQLQIILLEILEGLIDLRHTTKPTAISNPPTSFSPAPPRSTPSASASATPMESPIPSPCSPARSTYDRWGKFCIRWSRSNITPPSIIR